MKAVLAGHGVALARTSFAAPDIDSGRLARPFNQSVKAKFSHYVAYPIRSEGQDKIARFKEWILAEATGVPQPLRATNAQVKKRTERGRRSKYLGATRGRLRQFFSRRTLLASSCSSPDRRRKPDPRHSGRGRIAAWITPFPFSKRKGGVGEAALALASRGRNRGWSRQAPLPAAPFARPQSDQNGLRQAQGCPSKPPAR
jgi:hypothetical protein